MVQWNNVGNHIIYKTKALKSNRCDYNNVYILVRGDITVTAAPATQVSFKNCAPFTKCITKINRTTVDDAEDLDLVIPIYNLIENGILRNAIIAVTLKYLNNFWRSLEMPLSNCKVEIKLIKWTKYCVLSAAGNDNINADSSNIIFSVNDTKLYVPVVTLSARDNQKLPKLLSKGFERSVYWNKDKTKSENKNTKNESRYFLK